jgi:hypothetical protein
LQDADFGHRLVGCRNRTRPFNSFYFQEMNFSINDMVVTPWKNRLGIPACGVIKQIEKDIVTVYVYNAYGPGANATALFEMSQLSRVE